ncbi:hypothetical protein E2C01_065671 [Portunus trituberculatus]|uniref:Uncharacterized protein n=1 Tax=Portunus trituberculatus TaxID=210409 RepID=A0A5B7HMQ0_PORTR|nr:hypothetical protein [Portunus trituberculatus]
MLCTNRILEEIYEQGAEVRTKNFACPHLLLPYLLKTFRTSVLPHPFGDPQVRRIGGIAYRVIQPFLIAQKGWMIFASHSGQVDSIFAGEG